PCLLCSLHVLLCASTLIGLLLTFCFSTLTLSFRSVGACASFFGPLALTLLGIGNGLLFAAAQRDHARIFGVLRSVASRGLHRLPLLAAVIILSAIERSLRLGQ